MAENYRVVCLINNAVKCATCRRSCVYVEQVKMLVNSDEPPSDLLHKFVDILTTESPKVKSSVHPTLQSSNVIPVNTMEDHRRQ